MTSAGYPQHDPPLHKVVHDLLCALHGVRKTVDTTDDPVKTLLNQLFCVYEKRIENLDNEADTSAFTIEWTRLTWSLLSVISRLTSRFIDPRHVDHEEQQLTKRLNIKLFDLINKARPVRPPPTMLENDYRWVQFYGVSFCPGENSCSSGAVARRACRGREKTTAIDAHCRHG
ncbi:hypothetical protein Y032_0394g623 [Ancylostoma ceylanicum]|uniref:Uncharacterized protein n=1 Tax=Ancylostoma ceylanicum TaxID=53326 RepID=A0A016RRT3_9BILA|nr:hypothetical protein Y032_0394g623 [Ancylostoma ceylanicum]